MRNILLGILLAGVAFTGCGSKQHLPSHILEQDKMEAILWDLIRADLFISNYMVIKDSALDKKQQGIELYSLILKQHKVTQEQFKESFLYYRSHTLLLRELMDSLSHHQTDTLKPKKLLRADDAVKGKDTVK